MAEGFEYNVTLIENHEPFFDLHCQPCNRGGNHVEAYGYCKDCKEYLCCDCFNNHTKHRPCRDHVLLGKNDVPEDSTLAADGTSSQSDVCTQKCEEHPHKVLKYHCPKHGVVVCGVCVTVSHILCGVDYIPDIAKGIGESDKFKIIQEMLIDLATKVQEIIDQSHENISNIQKCYNDALSDIQLLRKDINEMIDLLERKVKADAGALKMTDMNKMHSIHNASNTLLAEINDFRGQLEQMKVTNQECDLFTRMKSSTEKLHALEDRVNEYQENNDVGYYEFIRSDDLWDFVNNTCAFGKLVHRAKMIQPSRISSLTLLKDEYLKMKNPLLGANPTVTAMVMLNKDTLVALDGTNNIICVFDTNVFERTHAEKLTLNVWDMTRTGRSSVAITAPDAEKIIIYSVGKGIGTDKERDIDSRGRCVGLFYCKDMFYASFNKVDQYSYLAILDSFGVHLRIFDTANLVPGWNLPILSHIAISGDSIIVSDKQSVLKVDSRGSGKLQWIYKHADLDMPLGIAVTRKGLILVCGTISNNMHIISSDGKHLQTLLSEKDGQKMLRSIAYCEATGRLYMAQYGNDKLRVYKTH